jgi:competence protein ComEC
MNRRPLVAVAGFWIFGASVPSLWPETVMQAAALGCAIMVVIGCRFLGAWPWRLALVCCAAMLISTGQRLGVEWTDRSDLAALWAQRPVPADAVIGGWIASAPEVDGDLVAFRLAANRLVEADKVAGVDGAVDASIRETVMVRIKLQAREELEIAAQWRRGDAVKVTGLPERPGDAGNFGVFDYRAYLARQGIHWQWSAQGASAVLPLDDGIPLSMWPLRTMDQFRLRVGQLIDRLYPHGDAGYMKGLVAGIRDEIDPEQYDGFSRLGLTHVLAISGLHVGVVVFVLLRLCALFRLTRERSFAIAMAAMPLYMLATGASPSAVRACLMAMIALALARRHLLKDGLHLLAAAAMVMVAWDPGVVEDVSFQLSFVVTAGLLLFTRDILQMLDWVKYRWLQSALAVGITAQAASLPLTIYYFNSFHLLSLPANLLIVPLVSFAVLPLGMASVVLGGIWEPLGIVFAWLATHVNRLTFWIVDGLNAAASLRTVWPQPSRLWVVAAYVFMGATFWLVRSRKSEGDLASLADGGLDDDRTAPLQPSAGTKPTRSVKRNALRRYASGLLIVLLWSSWWLWAYRPAFLDQHAYVQFLDVGQGDSILVRTGTGKHLLIDAGGTVRFRKEEDRWRERREPYEIGQKLIVPLLWQRGVRHLDVLVLTHLDADHIGGAEAVLREISVGALVWNGTWKDDDAVERLFQLAIARDVPVYAVRGGDRWEIDRSAMLEVLHPLPDPLASTTAENAAVRRFPVISGQNGHSIVLRLKLYGRTFLLTGDLEAAGERLILAALAEDTGQKKDDSPGYAPIDVLKVAHHGSRTSTQSFWLAWWRPKETVISVGGRNIYGHPHPTVVERIRSTGSQLWRTDRDGEIQYRIASDGTMQRRNKRSELAVGLWP